MPRRTDRSSAQSREAHCSVTMAAQPRLTYTPVEEIGGVVERLRASFEAGRTQSLDWRKRQLQGISQLVKDNATDIAKAVQADLRRPVYVSSAGCR